MKTDEELQAEIDTLNKEYEVLESKAKASQAVFMQHDANRYAVQQKIRDLTNQKKSLNLAPVMLHALRSLLHRDLKVCDLCGEGETDLVGYIRQLGWLGLVSCEELHRNDGQEVNLYGITQAGRDLLAREDAREAERKKILTLCDPMLE